MEKRYDNQTLLERVMAVAGRQFKIEREELLLSAMEVSGMETDCGSSPLTSMLRRGWVLDEKSNSSLNYVIV